MRARAHTRVHTHTVAHTTAPARAHTLQDAKFARDNAKVKQEIADVKKIEKQVCVYVCMCVCVCVCVYENTSCWGE